MVDLISAYWVVFAIAAAIGAATGFWILSSRRHVELPRIEIGQKATQTLARTLQPSPTGGVAGASFPPLPFEVRLDPDVHPDDLLQIKGIGPKLARMLIHMGITHYDQIAAWSATDIAAVDERLGDFAGRVARDNWVEQARLLGAGDIPAYEAKFGRLIGAAS
ncbi:helix-hairpin-helix domain-containing protein [Sphingomonas sp. SUN039]|uniref:helix-hairpin-helix domain-containing protein n=1 Tax=Sphingomonas sp. SUN039 TaxID=2937787 RepID=UPI002164CEEA|nr:helix-hairpin-helix domain-containing protein [Sphingomonas sp. SUN039]UVO54934.1 helix-hairpin-helix domain-containing protein [Sphingomonas sp. SUN039]